MATDKYGIKSHTRNRNLNIYNYRWNGSNPGWGREGMWIGVWRNQSLYLSLSNTFFHLNQCGIPNWKKYKTASDATKWPEAYTHSCVHALTRTHTHTQWIELAMSVRGVQTLVSRRKCCSLVNTPMNWKIFGSPLPEWLKIRNVLLED